MRIIEAGAEHAEAITAIYNDVVETTTAIWSDVTVTAANRAVWVIKRRSEGFPVLVAVDESGDVLGYAAFSRWRPAGGNHHTVEHTLYVHSGHRGHGVGTALLGELVSRATQLGKHVMIVGIDADNEAAIRLHERFGFRRAGLLQEVGSKFGSWLDLLLMQLVLSPQHSLNDQ